MTLRNVTFLLFACLIFASCKEDKFAKYEGIWDGSFSGNESGTMKIRIKEDGVSEGVAYPLDSEGQAFTFTGSVNEDGELTMSATVFNRSLIYEAFLTETDLTGYWSGDEGNLTGTWSGNKRVQEDRFPYGRLLYP
jgi:hypothetical protein